MCGTERRNDGRQDCRICVPSPRFVRTRLTCRMRGCIPFAQQSSSFPKQAAMARASRPCLSAMPFGAKNFRISAFCFYEADVLHFSFASSAPLRFSGLFTKRTHLQFAATAPPLHLAQFSTATAAPNEPASTQVPPSHTFEIRITNSASRAAGHLFSSVRSGVHWCVLVAAILGVSTFRVNPITNHCTYYRSCCSFC